MPSPKVKYGLTWSTQDDAAIEIEMIRGWGYKKHNGKIYGQGLAKHLIALQKLIWPDKDWHRWNEGLLLPEICRGGTTAIFGPGSSGKTHEISDFILSLYFAFPRGLTCICSTTTTDMLDFRIFGQIKSRLRDAKERFPWLPGHVVGSKHMIVTDHGDVEDRDFRDGIKGVACVQGGVWKGLGNYVGIKNKIMILAADECFPAGSLVDTPKGKTPIEKLKVGDAVICAIGEGRIQATRRVRASALVTIKSKDGRSVTCTPEHPFFTNQGWVKACNLNQSHYMLSANEALHILLHGVFPKKQSESLCRLPISETESSMQKMSNALQSGISDIDAKVLQSILQDEIRIRGRGISEELFYESARRANFSGKEALLCNASRSQEGQCGSYAENKLHGESRDAKEGFSIFEENWVEASSKRRKWDRADAGRESFNGEVSSLSVELSDQNLSKTGKRLPNKLQGGFGLSRDKAGCGSGRELSQHLRTSNAGYEERDIASGAWVDCVEIQEQENLGGDGTSDSGNIVYNLQVEGHPSYSVNGFLVHNCALMQDGFLRASANLKLNPIFFGIYTGNLSDLNNPLAEVAEPELGWDSIGDSDKSRVYKTKLKNGRAVQLIGTDSPNFDYPEGQEPYPHLIGRSKIAEAEVDYGKDTPLFNMFAKGKIPRDTMENRVVTELICEKFDAFEPVTWGSDPTTKLYCADISYTIEHGDRTCGMPMEFGKDVLGEWRIAPMDKPLTYSLSPSKDAGTPEEQIALQMKDQCARYGIEPSHVFYDGTGRSSFTSAIMRLWSTQVNAVEFGGAATTRPNFMGRKYKDNNERKGAKKGELMPCNEVFGKLVTEFWFASRYAIEGSQVRGLHRDTVKDGHRRIWILGNNNKIDVEPKKEMKERTGRSPDLYDMFVVGIEGARRLGFPLGKLEPEKKNARRGRWLRDVSQRFGEQMKEKELVTT